MKGHWHAGADHLIVAAVGTMLVFQVVRLLAGRLASSDNTPVSNLGKSIGGLFSFPAQ